MTESKADAEKKALESWYKPLLDNVVKEMIRLKAINAGALQASPMWMVPNEILIAKVWGLNQESEFIWTISIDKFIADYLAGSLAATPRDVARHFSLKWQMDADRIMNLNKEKPATDKGKQKMQAYAQRLIQYAETLAELANRDEAWEQLQATGN